MNTNVQSREAFSKKFLTALTIVVFSSSVGIGGYGNARATIAPQGVTQQQTINVKGTVVDSKGEAVIGASIFERGSKNNGTITDIEGHFSLKVRSNAVLTISYIGFKPQVINVEGKSSLNIVLQDNAEVLDEVVVVGYGTQKKENLTGAVTSVDVAKVLDGKPIFDVQKGLQGIAPGLTITYKSGEIDAKPDIAIRGLGSLNGKGAPLLLLDGVEISDLSLVNPSDISNISVLKDAASSSIYGARAAFGVVLITTKNGSGTNGKVQVQYNNNLAWNYRMNLPEYSDPIVELQAGALANNRAGIANPEVFGMYFPQLIKGITTWKEKYANNRKSNEMVYGEDWEMINGQAYFYRVWNPFDEMLNKNTFQQNHNISVSGSTSKSNYNISLGYSSQEGWLKQAKENNYSKINGSLSFNTDVTDRVNLGLKVMLVDTSTKYPYAYQSYYQYFMRWGAYFPYGTYEGKEFRHSAGFLRQANTCEKGDILNRYSANATVKIIDGLAFKTDFTYGTKRYSDHQIGGTTMAYNFWTAGNPYSYVNAPGGSTDETNFTEITENNWAYNGYFTYDKKIAKKHGLKVIAGMNAENYTYKKVYVKGTSLMSPELGHIGLTSGLKDGDSRMIEKNVAGFFFRTNYDYNGKLLLEVNGRYDGSSLFPKNDKWAFFPSASLGYRISEEVFMEPLKPYLSDMKFRASYGSIGNQDVGSQLDALDIYQYLSVMKTTSANWVENGKKVPTVGNPRVVPASLTWETVKTLDLGIDTRFFNNELGFSFDWFQRTNSNMLGQSLILPEVFGAEPPKTNAGTMRTRGWEIALDYNHQFNKDLRVYATASLSDYKSEITKFENSKIINSTYDGKEVGEIWGFETDRYWTADDKRVDIAKYQGVLEGESFQFGPGDIKYKDLNGNGVLDWGKSTLEDHGDLKRIGNTTPRYQYSLRIGAQYKDFDFETTFQGVGKRDLWLPGDVYIPYYSRADVLWNHQTDYWTESNPNAFYPRLYPGNSGAGSVFGLESGKYNFYPQSKYLVNAAYLRVKNITLGYTIPASLVKKAKIQKCRLYVSGQNLLTFDNMGALPVDPEVNTGEGINSGGYGRTAPFSRTYSCGVQVTF